jgi:hypothetical protein
MKYVYLFLVLFFIGCAPRTLVVDNTHESGVYEEENRSAITWDTQAQGEAWVQQDQGLSFELFDWGDETSSQTTYPGEEAGTLARIPFPIEEYMALSKNGSGTVKGKVYLQGIYGEKVIGKNTRLYLNPVTSYSNQWYEESYLGGEKMGKADPKLYNYLRFTSSNHKGSFAFYGVPSGQYYLIGTVKCKTACGYTESKVIRVATKVSVRNSQVVQQDLMRVMEVP